MLRLGATFLVAILYLWTFQKVEGQDSTITVAVNGQKVNFTIATQFVGIFNEITELIIQSLPGNTIDVKECSSDATNNCTDNQTCVEISLEDGGGFLCPCRETFVKQTADGECEPDLCLGMNITCPTTEQCNNNASNPQCICAVGFRRNGTACELITPCFPSNCSNNSRCNATGEDTFECICNDGYNQTDDCADIDECYDGTRCHENAICINSPGSFTCECNGGFSGNGSFCADIDECTTGTNDCSANADCLNTVGSFLCTCRAGYSGPGTTCIDIDECAAGTDNCQMFSYCGNTIGSFTCLCNDGFTGNETVCIDIDECTEETDNCDDMPRGNCENTLGSFTCSCNEGYSGNGRSCVDIDECDAGSDNCDPMLATCNDTDGSFTCQCAAGYTGNGTIGNCKDIDECAVPTNNDCAPVGSMCTNTNGGFECDCASGYNGNGSICLSQDESVFVTIVVRSTSRRKRATSQVDLQTDLEQLLRVLVVDNTINVTILNYTDVGSGETSVSLLIARPPKLRVALERSLSQLQGRDVGGCRIEFVGYSVTETFSGFAVTGNDSSSFCESIKNFINDNLSNSAVNCSAIKVNDTVTFTVTVEGVRAGGTTLFQILQGFSPQITASRLCESSPCVPDGNCDDSTGSIVCSCPGDSHDLDLTNPGTRCGSPILEPQCGFSAITVQVYASYFFWHRIDISTLHLLDTSCGDNEGDPQFLTITSNLGDCGWQKRYDNDDLVYFNNITNMINGVHVASPSVAFPVTCTYPVEFNTTGDEQQDPIGSNVMVTQLQVQSASGSGTLLVEMRAFLDSAFSQEVRMNTTLVVGQEIYLEASHSGGSTTNFLRLLECYATPTADPSNTNTFQLISDSCEASGNVDLLSSGENNTASFSMAAIAFDSSTEFFVHCSVRLCQRQCKPNCTSFGSGRRRRNAEKPELVLGPFHVEERVSNSNSSPEGDGTTPVSNNSAVIALTIVVGIILVALVLFLVQRVRKKGGFKNAFSLRQSSRS